MNNRYYSTHYLSPLGGLTLASDGKNIAGLWMEGQKYFGDTIPAEMTEINDLPVFAAAENWLDRYFAGEKPAVSDLPLAPVGNTFRQIVWEILCEIPYGEITTYGEIAKEVAVCTKKRCRVRQSEVR